MASSSVSCNHCGAGLPNLTVAGRAGLKQPDETGPAVIVGQTGALSSGEFKQAAADQFGQSFSGHIDVLEGFARGLKDVLAGHRKSIPGLVGSGAV